jgi:hypothetical protein
MYRDNFRFLFVLLGIALLCSVTQATNLNITVQDNIDNATISHATIFLNNVNYAKTNNNGQAFISHAGVADLNIRIVLAGYDEWQNIVNRNTTDLLVNLSRKTLTLTVTLYDSDTLTTIQGASINLTAANISLGKQTNFDGNAIFAVQAATLYSVAITHPKYQDRTGTIDMGADDRQVQYWLLPANRYSFIVKDKDTKIPVSDAEVRINDVLSGKTDTKGILLTPLERAKTYTIVIKKTGYQTYTETRAIGDSDALLMVNLAKAPIGAYIYVNDDNHVPISGAEVSINGTASGTTNQYGRCNFPNLVTGDYTIEIKKAGYVPVTRGITVLNTGEDQVFVLPLESAELTLFVQDKEQKLIPNASVSINSYLSGNTDDHGQFVTKLKFNTIYNITASKEGYQSNSLQKQIVQGNATGSATLTLEKNTDWGLVGMIVAGIAGIFILFTVIRSLGRKRRRHVARRNEI